MAKIQNFDRFGAVFLPR